MPDWMNWPLWTYVWPLVGLAMGLYYGREFALIRLRVRIWSLRRSVEDLRAVVDRIGRDDGDSGRERLSTAMRSLELDMREIPYLGGMDRPQTTWESDHG